MSGDLDFLIEEILEEATIAYQRDGHVYQTMWAIGKRGGCFAQPIDRIGLGFSDDAKLTLHAVLAAIVDARFVGFITEAVHSEVDEDEIPDAGDVLAREGLDPMVRTAICVDALDVVDDLAGRLAALRHLDDLGATYWESIRPSAVSTDLEETLRSIGTLSTASSLSMTPEQVKMLFDQLHWTVAGLEEIAP